MRILPHVYQQVLSHPSERGKDSIPASGTHRTNICTEEKLPLKVRLTLNEPLPGLVDALPK